MRAVVAVRFEMWYGSRGRASVYPWPGEKKGIPARASIPADLPCLPLVAAGSAARLRSPKARNLADRHGDGRTLRKTAPRNRFMVFNPCRRSTGARGGRKRKSAGTAVGNSTTSWSCLTPHPHSAGLASPAAIPCGLQSPQTATGRGQLSKMGEPASAGLSCGASRRRVGREREHFEHLIQAIIYPSTARFTGAHLVTVADE